jgi:sigma54-dependent transcription regulator
MEPTSAAEELPGLYRAVLDRVGELEASGRRDLANTVRAEATRIYSRSWDDHARRALLALLRRNTDALLQRDSMGRSFRRRVPRTV